MIITKKRITKAIRESIDSSPDGLCFATPDGMPVLVNRQMNSIVECLLGHTVVDASSAWDELKYAALPSGNLRLDEPWLYVDSRRDTDTEQLVFELKDRNIWRFQRSMLAAMRPPMVQITAIKMTKLYRLSRELYTNNKKIKAMQDMQKTLLANIVQVNREKELLAAKIRIHDKLGQCLVATRESLANKNIRPDDAVSLRRIWEDTIRDLSNIPLANPSQSTDSQTELLAVAQMIGCHIIFHGSLPKDVRAQRLLNMAIREALTNAVRHAGADTLTVSLENFGKYCKAEITDNGAPVKAPIVEGGGLGNLRRSLEQEGGALDIRCDGAVALTVTLPLS